MAADIIGVYLDVTYYKQQFHLSYFIIQYSPGSLCHRRSYPKHVCSYGTVNHLEIVDIAQHRRTHDAQMFGSRQKEVVVLANNLTATLTCDKENLGVLEPLPGGSLAQGLWVAHTHCRRPTGGLPELLGAFRTGLSTRPLFGGPKGPDHTPFTKILV